MPAKELFNLLLNEAGVACLWGTAFGAYGDGYLHTNADTDQYANRYAH